VPITNLRAIRNILSCL